MTTVATPIDATSIGLGASESPTRPAAVSAAAADHGGRLTPEPRYVFIDALRGIAASDLVDFAHQARARFWIEPLARQPRLTLRDLNQEEQRPLVAAVAT